MPKQQNLRIIQTRRDLWERLLTKAPQAFDFSRISLAENGEYITSYPHKDGVGAVYPHLSTALVDMAQEELTWIIRQELKTRGETHPLKQIIAKQKYLQADIPAKTKQLRQLLMFAKRLQKFGF